jgi:hypothetical protein
MRTSNQISDSEVQAYQEFCRENHIVTDGSEDSNFNADLVRDYFTVTWPNEISRTNLALAKAALMPHLRVYPPDALEFQAALAKLTPAEQQTFSDWVPPRGLVINNRGLTAIVEWIKAHNFNLTKENLQLAVGQQRVAPFLEWSNDSAVRPTSRHLETDDGTPFLGEGLRKLPDGSYGKTRADYAREAREAQEKANPQTAEHKLSVEDASWKRVALEACAFGTHSQQSQIRKVYDQSVAAGLDWRKVCEACTALRNTFKRNEMIQNRSGYYSR